MSRSASDGERGNEIWVITPYLRHMSFSLFMWTCWQTQLSLLMHRVMSREVGGAVTKMAHCVYCSGRPMSVPLLNIGVPSPADQLSQWKLPVDPTSKWALKSHTHKKTCKNRGCWHFICFNMFEMPPGSLTTELHCLHTATSASVPPSLFRLRRLKCFHRSNFSLVFGNRVYSISWVSAIVNEKKFFSFGELLYFPMCFSEITEYTYTR